MIRPMMLTAALAAMTLLAPACSNRQDGRDLADDANEALLDSGRTNLAGNDDQREDGAEFMTAAAEGGMFEIESARLAMQKASMQKTKDIARQVMSDHEKSSRELKALAERKNIMLPTSLSSERMDKLNNLREKTGRDFDERYSEMLVDSHEKQLELYTDAERDVTDQDIRGYISSQLPVLRQHHEMARGAKAMADNSDRGRTGTSGTHSGNHDGHNHR